MEIDRKNPGVGDIVNLKCDEKLIPILITHKEEDMNIEGWIFGHQKIVRTPPMGVKFGDGEGQWRLKD